MRRWLIRGGLALLVLLVLAAAWATWHVRSKLPQRSGQLALAGLAAPVTVRWDEAGVPHIRAQNEADLYRALGYLHAQDRLFQMEMLRRLSRGELAEVLGPKLVETDRLFRTLGIRAHADAFAARQLARDTPANRTLAAYLDGVNQYQATRPAPLEFDLLGIPKRPFTPADVVSVAGYLAYSFAAALRTEPVLTHVRDKLGPAHLRIFDMPWQPAGAQMSDAGWQGLARVAALSDQVLARAGVPQLEGSNAWAVAGHRTAGGKPLLAGDPHIGFSVPAVWWEAHLQAPGFELYGHFQALNPAALLGHNTRFGWSLTMFQNDDLDLVAEKVNPDNPNQVWVGGRWVDLVSRDEAIAVKGAAPVRLTLRRSPHGPIINEALGPAGSGLATPVAMWWAFLETENPVLEAFHELNRADSLAKARAAVAKIHAPGLNVVWAHADGDIAWWAAAQLPIRPQGVDPAFILDGSTGQADKPGFHPFADNPQSENPAAGHVMSANHQPPSRVPVPGYYNLRDRAQRLQSRLADPATRWSTAHAQALQLDVTTGYARRTLAPLLPALQAASQTPADRALAARLAAWQGDFPQDSVPATLFSQLSYELARAAVSDEMGEALGPVLLRTRAMEEALPRLAADAGSPWWDRRDTPAVETRDDIVAQAWSATLAHLRATFGDDPAGWTWGRAHTLTHVHPLGRQPPLDRVFNVGPFPAPGTRETPNFMAGTFAPAPWSVGLGPSTRRVIDFADAGKAVGINPVGQSGVWGDTHYADQAQRHIRGEYRPQHLAEADVAAATRSTLVLAPR